MGSNLAVVKKSEVKISSGLSFRKFLGFATLKGTIEIIIETSGVYYVSICHCLFALNQQDLGDLIMPLQCI